MTTKLSLKAFERSTYVITVAFEDDNGTAVTPNKVSWDLSTLGGTIINERSNVTETPAESVDIVLTGSDLRTLASEGNKHIVKRLVTVRGSYNSDAGSDLELSADVKFDLETNPVIPYLTINVYEAVTISESISLSVD
ncbi:MAG: hypothetical protein DRI46_14260 [Chloroflexi bacterium]|nr:MAG: hypothetical protein DRI46_14260 [Chloroflexota bacterium]